MSIALYTRSQERAENPRGTEYRALGFVTAKLVEARESGDPGKRIEACFLNDKLWGIFLADLIQPENGLPAALKGQLISLALWVQRDTPKAMDGRMKLDAFIDVNREIMAGLSPASVQPPMPVAPVAVATPAGGRAAPLAARA